MKRSSSCFLIAGVTVLGGLTASCSRQNHARDASFTPSEVIDLGAMVTEDLPQRGPGKAFLKLKGFTRPNSFDVIRWTFPAEGGSVTGSNAYYTLFNHGGPHVDAPNYMGVGDGLDSYPVTAFYGPAKIFDAHSYALGRSIPVEIFSGPRAAGRYRACVHGLRTAWDG